MNRNGGFTLVELLLVMVIIGILAGAVVISVSGRSTEARVARTKQDLSTFQRAVETYALEHNDKYPKNLSELAPKYVVQVKNDPWGHAYHINVPGKGQPYDIFSSGPDEQPNTPDDLSCWAIESEPVE